MTIPDDPRAATWCQPISASSFGGEASRYDEKYEQLLAELAKEDSVSGGQCNWGTVLRSADELLRSKTKDMMLLSALCVALFKRDSFAGLASGLAAYAHLVAEHSAALFPNAKRQRGRAGAYTWLTERIIRELELLQGHPSQLEELTLAQRRFEELDSALRGELGELHPRVGPITRLFRTLIEQAQPPPPEPEPPPPPPPAVEEEPAAPASSPDVTAVTPAPAAPATAATRGELESDEQAAELLGGVVADIKRLAAYHLARSPTSALGLELAFAGSFLGVVPDGDRALASPSPRRTRELGAALQERRWDEIIGAVPALLAEGDLDLDTAFCLARALEESGHEIALAAVSSQALALYQLMGDLARPGADAAAWLAVLGRSAGDGGGAADAAPGDGADGLAQVIEQATGVASRRGLDAGCAMIQEELRRVASKAARFRLRRALAALCLDGGAPDLARPILQDLHTELGDAIRDWEPSLLVEVVTSLLRCNRALAEAGRAPPGLAEESSELMALLSRVDPQAAFRERGRR